MNVRSINGLAAATTTVEIGANLDADATAFAGAYAAGDLDCLCSLGRRQPASQPTFTRDVQVYDSLGRPHDLTLAFLRTGAANSWAVEIGAAAARRRCRRPPERPAGLGHPHLRRRRHAADRGADAACVSGAPGTPVDDRTGRPPTVRRRAPSRSTSATIGGVDGLSQFASPTNVAFVTQNGAEVGELNSVQHRRPGLRHRLLHQRRGAPALPAADRHLRQPGGARPALGQRLRRRPMPRASSTCAWPAPVVPASSAPSALEAANVDLAEEFTKMIVTQRAYSANAKIINTTDQMLDELIRMTS